MTDPSEPIPGNESALEQLGSLLASGEAIAFVGAGASAGLYPLWPQLVRRLADEAVHHGLATNEDREFWLRILSTRPQQAIRGIKEKLQPGLYGQLLREIFRPHVGPDGRSFTPVHGAVISMPFRGYVTTNFDPGLLEARLALRPDSTATGWCTWKDTDPVYAWLTGDIFREQPCPILFAHGIYERSDTILLEVGEYRGAYLGGAFRRLFDKLWGQERLVFVGFGFSDSWLDFLADEVLTQTASREAAGPRHVALLGLREDETYTPEMRRLFQDQYGASIVFYRIASAPDGSEAHGDLLRILQAPAGAIPAPSRPAPTAPTPTHGRPPQCWTHETTEDDRYVEPSGTIHRLDRWADDPEVRAIAVTGLGGLGKTALVGHWLKQRGGDVRRPTDGLFFWSFYIGRDVTEFLEALLAFAADELGIAVPDEGASPVDRARSLLQRAPLLLVLDGLEVLQERPGSVAYGALLDGDLRELLDAACRHSHGGLVILTSRFPFADLVPYLGTHLRALDLDGLSPDEGATLLQRCAVGGSPAERQEISRHLEGHPLALRVFAGALATQTDGDPSRVWQKILDRQGLRESDPLERKLAHLLAFYERELPPEKTALLGVISLFSTRVDESTVLTLGRKLRGTKKPLATASDDALQRQLQALCADHLLSCERDGGQRMYSCHPVIRDQFRRTLLSRDRRAAGAVADLLTEQPSAGSPKRIADLEPVLGAIELLLDAGDFQRADELYGSRLFSGRIPVLLALPAYQEGLRCALGFIADEGRRRACRESLSDTRFGFFLNEVGLFAANAGETDTALRFRKQSVEVARKYEDKHNLRVALVNQSEFYCRLGRLEGAESAAREAVAIARDIDLDTALSSALSSLGEALTNQGRVVDAAAAFDEANAIQLRIDHCDLYSLRGIHWAALLLRLGHIARARSLTIANLKICEANEWRNHIALCRWILGQADTADGNLHAAAEHLAAADAAMRRGHGLLWLPSILLSRAELERRRGAWPEALHFTEEALRLAAPREIALAQADALVMRGRLTFDRALAEMPPDDDQRLQMERAQDDADAALTIARRCGYAWAERDALALLADTWQLLGDDSRALGFRRDADTLARRLRLDEPEPPVRGRKRRPKST